MDTPHSSSSLIPDYTDEDAREGADFLRILTEFHEQRGTPMRRVPHLGGREFDFHRCYTIVCRNGGYVQVLENRLFKAIAATFHLPPTCTNGGYQMRTHYQRYLYPYERVHKWGLEDDPKNLTNDPHLAEGPLAPVVSRTSGALGQWTNKRRREEDRNGEEEEENDATSESAFQAKTPKHLKPQPELGMVESGGKLKPVSLHKAVLQSSKSGSLFSLRPSDSHSAGKDQRGATQISAPVVAPPVITKQQILQQAMARVSARVGQRSEWNFDPSLSRREAFSVTSATIQRTSSLPTENSRKFLRLTRSLESGIPSEVEWSLETLLPLSRDDPEVLLITPGLLHSLSLSLSLSCDKVFEGCLDLVRLREWEGRGWKMGKEVREGYLAYHGGKVSDDAADHEGTGAASGAKRSLSLSAMPTDVSLDILERDSEDVLNLVANAPPFPSPDDGSLHNSLSQNKPLFDAWREGEREREIDGQPPTHDPDHHHRRHHRTTPLSLDDPLPTPSSLPLSLSLSLTPETTDAYTRVTWIIIILRNISFSDSADLSLMEREGLMDLLMEISLRAPLGVMVDVGDILARMARRVSLYTPSGRALLGILSGCLHHPLSSLRRISLSGISNLSLSEGNERIVLAIEREVIPVARRALLSPIRDQTARDLRSAALDYLSNMAVIGKEVFSLAKDKKVIAALVHYLSDRQSDIFTMRTAAQTLVNLVLSLDAEERSLSLSPHKDTLIRAAMSASAPIATALSEIIIDIP